MYGHDLIENLKVIPENSPIEKKEKYKMIECIKNSVHFNMGSYKSVCEMVWNKSYVNTPFFSGDMKNSIIPPYSEICLSYDIEDARDKNGSLDSITKGVVYINSTDEKSIFYQEFYYDNNDKDWLYSPILVIVLNAKIMDGVPCDCVVKSILGEDISCFKFKDITANMEFVNFSLMLLNTKNIIAIDNPPPAKLNKKRIKNGKQPLFTYKTLRLQLPAKKRKKGSGPAMATDNTTRLHLCRGHFKTYTADKPLLGKFTGRYWWQPHARGDKAKGVVMKDYAVDIG